MKRFFYRLFYLYPGEGRNAAIFSAFALIWSIVISSGMEFSEALFLIRVGADSLPLAYGLTALGMIPLALVFLHGFHRLGVYQTFFYLISLGVVFYGSTFALLQTGFLQQWFFFWYALKIFGYIFFSFGLTSFWTFVDEYYNIRDAKRLYTLFSTHIFLGIAMTGLLMRAGVFSLNTLLLFLIGLICLSLFAAKMIHTKIPAFKHEETEQETSRTGQAFALPSLIRSILKSRITLSLLMGNFLMQLCTVITEFNYFSDFSSYFYVEDVEVALGQGTSAALTRFMGQLVSGVSLFNIFFGLFLYSRLARKFGVLSLLSVTPLLLIFIFSGWLAYDTRLLFPILGFFITDGTIWLLDDNNFNIMLNAVPTKLKYKIRVTIESFFEPIGMLSSALILHFFADISKLIALVLATFWLIVTFIIRNEYLKGIFLNLAENAIHFSRTTKDWIFSLRLKQRKSEEFRLLAIVKHGDSRDKRLACQGLLSLEDASILKHLLTFASSMSVSEKIDFLQLIAHSPFVLHPQVVDSLETWFRNESDENLRGNILFYFAEHGMLHPEKTIDHLYNPHLLYRAAAITSVKKSMNSLMTYTSTDQRQEAFESLHKLLHSKDPKEVCMGIRIAAIDAPPSEVDRFIPYLKHKNLFVSRAAAAAIAETIDRTCRHHAWTLLHFLSVTGDHQVRASCLIALGNLDDATYVQEMIRASHSFHPHERRLLKKIVSSMGLKTVPLLLKLTHDTTLSDRSRLLAGRILGDLSLQQLRSRLSSLVRTEIERAYFYFYHAQVIQKENPKHDLHFLTHTLEMGYHSVIDFIIQLLAVAGEVEDEELLARSLRSENPKVRNQAIEAIERTCEPEIFRLLQGLIEDMPTTEKIAAYYRSGRKAFPLEALLDKLDASSTPIDQIIAATYKFRLRLPGWKESLKRRLSSNEELFHHFAYELLEE